MNKAMTNVNGHFTNVIYASLLQALHRKRIKSMVQEIKRSFLCNTIVFLSTTTPIPDKIEFNVLCKDEP